MLRLVKRIVGEPQQRRPRGQNVRQQLEPIPSPGESLCELVNPGRYLDPAWMKIHRELETYSNDKHVFSLDGSNVYRKGWEWTQTLYGLMRLGMIDSNKSAVGVGAGKECLMFWFAEHLSEVVATDLYGNEIWSTQGAKEADPDIVKNPLKYCPRRLKHRGKNLHVLTMDGTALKFEDERFDVAWSMSSIEHFGGHKMAAQAVREMARVIKKQGIVVIATEYLLLDEYTHPEYFNKQDIFDYIVNASPNLELVEPIDFSLPPSEYLIDSVVLPDGAGRTRRHVVLNDGQVQWTSIMIFLRKV